MKNSLVAFLALSLFLSSPLFAEVVLDLQEITTGLTQPVFLTHAGDGSGRLFVVEQAGRIRIVTDGILSATPFLDISDRVTSGGERGLLGLAFHRSYEENGFLFVNYTTTEEGELHTFISRFSVSADDPDQADPDSEKVILQFAQPFANHNGGMLAFDAEGLLYISTGDGGSGGDPLNNGQSLDTLLGKILRIDVDGGDPYAIPPTNPFLGVAGAREEIFAFGLRNPWRFSFDRATGRLFAGDVGQGDWEEVDIIRRGGNYGWNQMEGAHCFMPGCNPQDFILPIAEYDHLENDPMPPNQGSVTGGYVYRGTRHPFAGGTYVFGDFVSGKIWALDEQPDSSWERRQLLDTSILISSFGQDEAGELYVLDIRGSIFSLTFEWRQIFVHAGAGQSGPGSFSSIIFLTNPGSQPVTGEMRFFDQDGNPAVVTINDGSATQFPFDLQPASASAFAIASTTSPFFVGWAEVIADRPIQGTLVFVLKEDGFLVPREAGISSSPGSAQFLAPMARSPIDSTSSALALANPNSEAITIELILQDGEGVEIARTERVLPARGQVAFFLEEMAEVGDTFEGTLQAVSEDRFFATLLRTVGGVHSASLPLTR